MVLFYQSQSNRAPKGFGARSGLCAVKELVEKEGPMHLLVDDY